MCAGPLVAEWANAGSLGGLQNLDAADNQLTGSLPALWGERNKFPSLVTMDLSRECLL